MILTAHNVSTHVFDHSRFREGYRIEEVDPVIARISQTLQAWESSVAQGSTPTGVLTAEDVLTTKFQRTMFHDGYKQDDVDEYLDDVVTTLRWYESGDSDNSL